MGSAVTGPFAQFEQAVYSLCNEVERLQKALDAERKYSAAMTAMFGHSLAFIGRGFSPAKRRGRSVRDRFDEVVRIIEKSSVDDSFKRATKDEQGMQNLCLSTLKASAEMGHPSAGWDKRCFESFEKNISLLDGKRYADMGCAPAQLWYGRQTSKEDYLRLALEQGLYDAKRELGSVLCCKGEQSSIDAGIRFIKEAADNGDELACLLYASRLYIGRDVQIDRAEAARYFKLAADEGDCYAKERYAERLLTGDGVPRNEAEAVRYFKLAADEGDWEAKERYA